MKWFFINVSMAYVLLGTTAFAASDASVQSGKQLAFERSKGNCLACHQIEDGKLAGNMGPLLANMKQRFPNRSTLRAQIWDATENNPTSLMPPFGGHRILTENEIDLIVDYLYTL